MNRLFEQLRHFFFWTKDIATGGKIKMHLSEIKSINNASAEMIAKYHEEKLSKLIRHVEETVPYYRYQHSTHIASFPIVTKVRIREYLDQFISNQYDKRKLLTGATSGSTGTPFIFYKDTRKKQRNDADFIYFYEKGNFQVGERLYYVRMWNGKSRKSKIASFLQNIQMVHVEELTEKGCEELALKLEKDQGRISILSYASSLEFFAPYASNRTLRLKTVFSTSEVLTEEARAWLAELFKCNVYSRYATQENGVLAQQFDDSPLYEINHASYYIEVLSLDSAQHVASGEVGRVVITDLFNYAMPMIRYDTLDLARFSVINGRKYLSSIEGRAADVVFDTSGNRVLPFTLMVQMWHFYEQIKQYQFVQLTATRYLVRFIPKTDIHPKEQEVQDIFGPLLGMDAEIAVEIVEDIPALASGKRKMIVNEFSAKAP